jgi:hypothetical protein
MAKIITQTIEIKLSKIYKDDTVTLSNAITEELIQTLETVVQELVDPDILVEVEEK